MKIFNFSLDRFQASQLFSVVRTKKDIIATWMRAIKLMSVYVDPGEGARFGSMRLHVDKMSRLFFVKEDKSYSINFPFFTDNSAERLTFSAFACSPVDNRVTSEVLSLLSTYNLLDADDIYSFLDPISNSLEVEPAIWSLLKNLMMCDDGYIRVDHDEVRANGNLHPLDHIDVFYEGASTFKIGLVDRLSLNDFADLLDVGSDCHFLHRK